MRNAKLRAGVFVAPFHALDESPTLCLERDLELARVADDLGYAEIWYGEHHSGAYELSASPELMIAAAAQRTKRIRLGSGVISLPYHNPLMAANRIVQLDHLTGGRMMFGAGPGLLVGDAHMLGLNAEESRDKLDRGIAVIKRLLGGDWVTEKYDGWYDLQDAHCQLLPLNDDLEICVASTMSPSGGTLAAKYDTGMLCLAAGSISGYDALAENWRIAVERAAAMGRHMPPSRVRCAVDVHVAETREIALSQVRAGYEKWRQYIDNQAGHLPQSPSRLTIEQVIERNEAVIGTPDDVVQLIRRLDQKVPGFGTLLLIDKNWASFEDKKRSMELIARHVLPEINGDNANRRRSYDWTRENREGFVNIVQSATQRAIEKHLLTEVTGD